MPKPTKQTARETLGKLGLRPDRWGNYSLGDYRLKFQKASIRVERRHRGDSKGGGFSSRLGTIFYSRIEPGDLERIVDRLKTELKAQNRE